MHNRATRLILVGLLIAVAAAAAIFLQTIDRRLDEAAAAADASGDGVSRLADVIAEIRGAQARYVAIGQDNAQAFERTASLAGQLNEGIGALTAVVRSSVATEALRALAQDAEALISADNRARENLRLEQPLMASDVLFSDSYKTLDAMSARLRELRVAELRARDDREAALIRQRWTTLAAAAALWLAGVLALVPIKRSTPMAVPEPAVPAAPPAPAVTVPAAPDLSETAALCTDISRMASAALLPALLDRAASILDASGIILWMGAGEELFAVTAHGYPPQLVARLGRISRAADNATASAWRSGRLTVVAAAGDAPGAIVAPMFSPETCVGVLAFEIRRGGEQQPATQAAAALVAAQLATAVSAWPAASEVEYKKAHG